MGRTEGLLGAGEEAMKGKIRAVALAAVALLGGLLGGPQPASADAGAHVFYINGISRITKQCQYVPAAPMVRDDLGIPKPSTLPPTCKKTAAGTDVPCTLKRNLGPYPANPASPNLAAGEVGLNPPCSGVLSADTLDGEQGCIDAEGDLNVSCELTAPTWFYGYCGQTYGGDSLTDGVGAAGTLKINGVPWKIEKLGFARGRGVWEFGAKLKHPSQAGNTAKARFYFGAIPNPAEPQNAAGCDGGPAITSVEFFGHIELYPSSIPLPPKRIRTAPGWHFCHDDPFFPDKPGGTPVLGTPTLPADGC